MPITVTDVLDKAVEVSTAKRHDYADSTDPWRNFRRSQAVGVEPWRGALIRMLDKVSRFNELQTKQAAVKNESANDTLLDLVNYAAIVCCLIEEEYDNRIDITDIFTEVRGFPHPATLTWQEILSTIDTVEVAARSHQLLTLKYFLMLTVGYAAQLLAERS